jgi:methionine-rich copper-binding protein CopC
MKKAILIVLAASVVLVGIAFAHSKVKKSTPKDGEIVKVMPKTIKLEFDEGLVTKFSTFKVYKLETKSKGSEQLESEAEALAAKLMLKKGDANARADTGFKGEADETTKVTVNLKTGLKPGVYVVMWRLLGTDTHTVSGNLWFQYKP